MNLPKILGAIWLYAQRPLLTAIIVILAVLGFQYSLHAAQLDDEGREMFRLMHKQQGFPMPVSYPVYHMGFTEDMPTVCAGFHACYVRGHIWIISLAVMLNEQERLTSIFHENIHHLQYEKSGSATTCEENYDREIVAYKAEQIFVSENYHRYTQKHLERCPPPK
jgi:hypothetical protein